MSNWFNLILDTFAPSNPLIIISGGATATSSTLVNCTISVDDVDTTGYQMLIWGDVDNSQNPSIQSTMGASSWIVYSSIQQVRLSSGDGIKNIYLKVRDDVLNESSQVSDQIILSTIIPTVTVSAPSLGKISKVSGRDTTNFTFLSDTPFVEYKVTVVPLSNSTESSGIVIPVISGSSNMSNTGSFSENSAITCTINGSDLQSASSSDGTKIIKVFVKTSSGQWSV